MFCWDSLIYVQVTDDLLGQLSSTDPNTAFVLLRKSRGFCFLFFWLDMRYLDADFQTQNF